MRQQIVAMGFLIICSLISSCEQREYTSKVSTPTAFDILVSTSMPTVVATASLQPSPIPSFTLAPISTSSPSSTATNYRIAAPSPLSNAILTIEEVVDQYSSLMGYFGKMTDVTDELLAGNNCLLDCVKHVWSAGQYGPRHLIIILVKSSSSTKAQRFVEDTRKTFTDIDDLSDRPTLAYLPKNVWSVYYYPRHEFVLNYSYGQVFVLVVSKPNEGFDDFAGEFDLISLVSRLQMEKLNSSGYVP